MKHILLSCFCAAGLCIFGTAGAESKTDDAKQQISDAIVAIEKYRNMAQGTVGKSELFVDATKLVNSALSLVSDRPEIEFLASYIYRSRGADSLAKQHFRKGCFMLQNAIEKDPKDAMLYLQYGAAMLCGDTTYWSNYKDYFHQGIEYVRKAYDLSQGKGDTQDTIYTRSVAEALTGDMVAFAVSYRALTSFGSKSKYQKYITLMNSGIEKNGWDSQCLMDLAIEYLKNDFFGVKI